MLGHCYCWRRWCPLLGQVVPVVGAGEEKGWGPAPRNAVLCPVVAQVQPQKSYLRQNGHRPAPGKVLTCAVMAIDLRQELRSTELCSLSFRPSGSEWRNLAGDGQSWERFPVKPGMTGEGSAGMTGGEIGCVPEGGNRFLDSACGSARNDRVGEARYFKDYS